MHKHLLVPVLAVLFACSGSSGDTSTDAGTGETGDTPTSGNVPTSGGGPLCGNAMLDDGEDCDGTELGGKFPRRSEELLLQPLHLGDGVDEPKLDVVQLIAKIRGKDDGNGAANEEDCCGDPAGHR